MALAPSCQRRCSVLGRQTDGFHWQEPNVRLAGGVGLGVLATTDIPRLLGRKLSLEPKSWVIGRRWCDSCIKLCFLFFFFLKILNYWLFLFQGQIQFHPFFPSFPGILCPVAMGTLAPLPSCQEGACLTVREMIEGLKGHRSRRSGSKTELPGHTPHPGPARDVCLACPGILSSSDPSVPQHLSLLETKTCCSLRRSPLGGPSPESFLQRPRPVPLPAASLGVPVTTLTTHISLHRAPGAIFHSLMCI